MNSSEKTVYLLKLLAREPYQFGLTELSKDLGCGKSGTFKLIGSLVKAGLADQLPNHKYTLGIASYLIGKCYEDNIGIGKFVRPYLIRLRDLTGEGTAFGMMINGRPTTVYREESTNLVRIISRVGEPRPMNAGAIGKTLSAFEEESIIRQRLMEEPIQAFTPVTLTNPEEILADLAKIREQGFTISDGEYSSETISFGAPVRGRGGRVWGALSLSAPRARITASDRERYVFMVKETARQMGEELEREIEQ